MIYERSDRDPIYSTVPGRLGSVTEISDLTGRIKFRYVDAQTGHWYSPRRFACLFNPVSEWHIARLFPTAAVLSHCQQLRAGPSMSSMAMTVLFRATCLPWCSGTRCHILLSWHPRRSSSAWMSSMRVTTSAR